MLVYDFNMNQPVNTNIQAKIDEDLSPTKRLTGFHLKIVSGIAIIWSFFQLWYASPFPFMFDFGMFKGLPARAIHLGFALLLAFLVCLLYTSDAADEEDSVDLGGRRIIKKISRISMV